MLTILIVIFVIAYAAIALEHPIKINKSASAILGAGLLWTVYAVMTDDHHLVGHQLNESLASTAQIVFFLMGGMNLVEGGGGARSPIGDVTTTMLWIGGQITALVVMKGVLAASLVNLILPLAVTSYLLKGREVVAPARVKENGLLQTTSFERNLMFFMGIGILICVPIFKTVTHLPPFMGILFGLGILWLVGELIHREKDDEEKEHVTLVHALMRIDMGSLVFFIGILLSVSTLEHTHILGDLAKWLGKTLGRPDRVVTLIGMGGRTVH